MKSPATLQFALVCLVTLLLVQGVLPAYTSAGPVDELGWLALGLAVVLLTALAGGHIAAGFGQPAVLGELLAGILIGNLPGFGKLQFLGVDPHLGMLAQIGMLLLMFEVGLGLSVRDIYGVGLSALLVAAIGTVTSFAVGTGTAALFMPAASGVTHVFLGAALTATSIGITARVLKDMGASRTIEARIILGAAVADDVLALVALGIVVGFLGSGQGVEAQGMATILPLVLKTVGFLTAAVALGARLTPTWFRRAAMLRTEGALLAIGLCFCFFLSWAASRIGLAALIGAFAAGLVLEDSHSEAFVQRGERSLSELLQPMTSFLVPVFFVLVGFRATVHVLADPALLALTAALTVAAIVGKLACAAGVLTRDARRLTVAIGMIPRGEVALVFAALGGTLRWNQAPVLDTTGYSTIVAVVILTTLVTPPALKWSMQRRSNSRPLTRPAA